MMSGNFYLLKCHLERNMNKSDHQLIGFEIYEFFYFEICAAFQVCRFVGEEHQQRRVSTSQVEAS